MRLLVISTGTDADSCQDITPAGTKNAAPDGGDYQQNINGGSIAEG